MAGHRSSASRPAVSRLPPWTEPAGGDATEGGDGAPQLRMRFGQSPAAARDERWWGTAAEGAC